MAFEFKNSKGKTYYLHSRLTTLKNGTERTIYYFAGDVRAEAIDAVPEKYKVIESKNGLPVLKKK